MSWRWLLAHWSSSVWHVQPSCLLRLCCRGVWYCATNTRRNWVSEKIWVVAIFNTVSGSMPVVRWRLREHEAASAICWSSCLAVVHRMLACREWCAAPNPRRNRVPRRTYLSPILNVLGLLLAQCKLCLSNGWTIHTFNDQSPHSKCCCQPETPFAFCLRLKYVPHIAPHRLSGFSSARAQTQKCTLPSFLGALKIFQVWVEYLEFQAWLGGLAEIHRRAVMPSRRSALRESCQEKIASCSLLPRMTLLFSSQTKDCKRGFQFRLGTHFSEERGLLP